MMKVKLNVAHEKCLNCGTERILYFTHNYTYGERIVSTKSGKKCAYANLIGENIIQELEEYCNELFLENGIVMPSIKMARIVANTYGVTCDEIEGEKIDTIPNTKCPNCLEKKMIEDKTLGEQLKEVEICEVTHNEWERLDKKERKEIVNNELIRQGYLMGGLL
ncbi:MAG: hypothetical protein J6A59_12880 [Lachnospiraceae bacterium]|nr:hypothetical protein [Lachnospiraceae bacterium]